MKAEAVRVPITFAPDDPDCTHTVQIRQGVQLFPLDYECTETEANWLVDRFMEALAAHDAEAQHRTDDLVRAVEGLCAKDPRCEQNWCPFCDCHSHDNDCEWIVLKAALAAYKDAKGKVETNG